MTTPTNPDLQRRLEAATSSDLGDTTALDADTIELRRTWTALAQLLDDETADTALPPLELPVAMPPVPEQRRQRWLWPAATAASLLLAIGAGLLAYSQWPRPVAQSTDTKAAAPNTRHDAQLAEDAPHRTAGATDTETALAWNDELEQPLQQAWLCAYQLQQSDATIDRLREHTANLIYQMQQDVGDNNSL